jgi:2'-5' RNA ligase
MPGERLFLAVPVDDGTRAALQAHLAALGTALPGRPVPPRNWHFTLRFLGDTQPAHAVRLRDGLRSADPGPRFAISFDRLGAFPRPARAAVLWIGVGDGAAEMRALAARADDAAVRAGLGAADKPFAPHVTVARIHPPRDVRPLAAEAPAFGARMEVRDVVLYRSVLGGGPPRYEPVEAFALR